jgi:hypothetical protein
MRDTATAAPIPLTAAVPRRWPHDRSIKTVRGTVRYVFGDTSFSRFSYQSPPPLPPSASTSESAASSRSQTLVSCPISVRRAKRRLPIDDDSGWSPGCRGPQKWLWSTEATHKPRVSDPDRRPRKRQRGRQMPSCCFFALAAEKAALQMTKAVQACSLTTSRLTAAPRPLVPRQRTRSSMDLSVAAQRRRLRGRPLVAIVEELTTRALALQVGEHVPALRVGFSSRTGDEPCSDICGDDPGVDDLWTKVLDYGSEDSQDAWSSLSSQGSPSVSPSTSPSPPSHDVVYKSPYAQYAMCSIV